MVKGTEATVPAEYSNEVYIAVSVVVMIPNLLVEYTDPPRPESAQYDDQEDQH